MNRFLGIGRLTKDPDTRYKQTGEISNARFTLAIDRNTQEKQTDFIPCVAFGKTAEFTEKYLKKGLKVALEGRIQTGSYEKDGKKVYTTDVIVERVEFCESKKDSAIPATDEQQNDFMDIPENIEESLPFK